MHDTAEALADAARRKQELTSMVSHDLRTPLMNIQTMLTLMHNGVYGELTPKAIESARKADENASRLIRLINDLLDIDKLEAGKLPLLKRKIELSEVFRATQSNVTYFSSENNVQLDFQENEIELVADPDRLTQVLTNLVSNAVKFSSSNSTVTVVADEIDDAVKISVCDQGRGIPKEAIAKLFKRFEQVLEVDSERGKGTGLGLSIAKAIVESHGGDIGVESEVDKGSKFWFTIPKMIVPIFIAISLSGCTSGLASSQDYYGLRCWERAAIAGDEARRDNRRNEALKYYEQAVDIAQKKQLGSERVELSKSRIELLNSSVETSDVEPTVEELKAQATPQPEQNDLRTNVDNLETAQQYAEMIKLIERRIGEVPTSEIKLRLRLSRQLGDAYNKTNQTRKTIAFLTPILHAPDFEMNCSDYSIATKILLWALRHEHNFKQGVAEADHWVKVVEADPEHRESTLASALKARENFRTASTER
jgi:hypothetical protein